MNCGLRGKGYDDRHTEMSESFEAIPRIAVSLLASASTEAEEKLAQLKHLKRCF